MGGGAALLGGRVRHHRWSSDDVRTHPAGKDHLLEVRGPVGVPVTTLFATLVALFLALGLIASSFWLGYLCAMGQARRFIDVELAKIMLDDKEK